MTPPPAPTTIDGAPVIDPLITKALDEFCGGGVFGDTRPGAERDGRRLADVHVAISPRRYHVDDLEADAASLGARTSPRRRPLPKPAVAAARVGTHADVFLYRWTGTALPSALAS